MTKYVNAGKMLEEYEHGIYDTTDLAEMLYYMPAADVVEVRHGHWKHLGGDEWFCTACGHVITTEGSWEQPWQKYCEECGAKMNGIEND